MKSLRAGKRTYRVAGEEPSNPSVTPIPTTADGDVQRYLDMDDDTRWQLLVRKVTESKRAGTMSDADLDAFATAARGMLEPAQYERLLSLIAALKG